MLYSKFIHVSQVYIALHASENMKLSTIQSTIHTIQSTIQTIQSTIQTIQSTIQTSGKRSFRCTAVSGRNASVSSKSCASGGFHFLDVVTCQEGFDVLARQHSVEESFQ